MTQRVNGIFDRFFGFFRSIFMGEPASDVAEGQVKEIHTHQHAAYTQEKRQKLESLCEQLFNQQEMLATGKLQFLGLGLVKRRLGASWERLKPVVFQTVEESISKYLLPKDIFISYKDDTYVIIFAEAGEAEAQIKATLIAEEIKRRLFEHEVEELRNIKVEETVHVVKTEKLRGGGDFGTIMDRIAAPDKEIVVEKTAKDRLPRPIKPLPKIEINPYEDSSNVSASEKPKKEEPAPPKEKPLNCTYVPLWDVKKNVLTTYLCLAQADMGLEDAFDCHEAMYMGTSKVMKSHLDIRVLRYVARDLAEIMEGDRRLYIVCPVHYETIMLNASHDQYILECQKIPAEHKKYLVFMILGLPEQIHNPGMGQLLGALKTHCHALYAQVPMSNKVDFYQLRKWHIDAVGVRLKKSKGSEKQMILNMESFSEHAKKALIKNVFALDIKSLSVTTSAVCSDFDFLGGIAIHETVAKPNNIYRFMHQDLFADMLND